MVYFDDLAVVVAMFFDEETDEMLQLLTHSHHVTRPYQQHFVTENGSNRVTLINFQLKFAGIGRECFRFSSVQVLSLLQILELPEQFSLNGYRTTSIEAICVTLHRLSSQCRLVDLSFIYDLRPQFISQIVNGFMVYIFRRYGDIVRSFVTSWSTDRIMLEVYAEKIRRRGSPIANCVGFVDGTHVPVARPKRGQRAWYCGRHRCHCFKSTAIQYPNGLISAFGPFDGNTHDSTAAQIMNLDGLVARHYSFPQVSYCLFGDSGYGISPSILTPYRRGPGQTAEEAEWNRIMSSLRISVEWGIGSIKRLWKVLSNKNCMRTLQTPVGIYWINAVLLTNLHTCMNGSQV